MTLPWYLTAIGLYLCTAAAWFMYRYPMSATMLAAGGAGEPMLSNPTAEGQRAFKRYQRCSRLGIGLLGVGFFLQLLGAILSAVGRGPN